MLKKLLAELEIIKERDPAARGKLEILICYPGLHAILLHRVSHWLWSCKVPYGSIAARVVSQVSRWITGIEIHPAALIGEGVFIDHGMGVVIGETAVVGNNCLLYQGVTLGGTGKAHGKRHPTLGENVVVGAGAKVLGAISVGANTRIGAGSVVLRDVDENCTVVGIPGRVIRQAGSAVNPLAHSALPDAEAEIFKSMMQRLDQLESELDEAKMYIEVIAGASNMEKPIRGAAQNLKDRQIIDFIGEKNELEQT